MIGIIGHKTSIAQAFIPSLGYEEPVQRRLEEMPLDLPRYLICMGYLAGQSLQDISPKEAKKTWDLNFIDIVLFCDRVYADNPDARICIIGSMSGIKGSFDMAYAGAKAALHVYIEAKRLTGRHAQLVGIAPTIIEDSGMTQRRNDLDHCIDRGRKTRRGSWLKPEEVAELAYFLLYIDHGAISNVVIPMQGGME